MESTQSTGGLRVGRTRARARRYARLVLVNAVRGASAAAGGIVITTMVWWIRNR
ncbi:MAG: hypothetical protein FWE15_13880 [Actinomycetia bacterium]|nr:hypothetical protein [Actinomycetes bacterium]